MKFNYSLVCATVLLLFGSVTLGQAYLDQLLSLGDHETALNEEIAQLLEIDYERQGSCGTDITSECCTACSYDGYCYNGGYCCELNKVRTRVLKSGETECPSHWNSQCKLTKLLPIESCKRSKGNHHHRHESDSSESDEDEQLDKTGVRLMCLCVTSKRCCTRPPTTTTFLSTAATSTSSTATPETTTATPETSTSATTQTTTATTTYSPTVSSNRFVTTSPLFYSTFN